MTQLLSPSEMRQASALLQQYFFSRRDTVAVLEDGGRPRPGSGDLAALLRTHLAGQAAPAAVVRYQNRHRMGALSGYFRVGSYCLNPESNVRWLCFDFDGGADHAASLEDPLGAALATQEAFEARGCPVYLERSGGGHGWHLWAFFTEPVAAAKARKLAFGLVPDGCLLTDGSPADPAAGRGIEVFPKQDRVGKKGFGNLVWLPWWHGAAEGGNQFVRLDPETGALGNWFPAEGFRTIDSDQLEALLRSLPPDRQTVKKPTAAPHLNGNGASPVSANGKTLPTDSSPDPRWEEWRREALGRLRLEDIYGTWLTGDVSSPGWLQCRDPWSASGDRNPSAGVADGTGTAERGTFHSFISGKSMSVFDFLMAMGRAGSFVEARGYIAGLTGTPVPTFQPAEDPTPLEFDLPDGSGGTEPQASATPQPSIQPPPPPKPPRRPEVVTNGRQLEDIFVDCWNVLHAQNSRGQPFLFERGGQLVRLRRIRETSTLTIEHLDESDVFGLLVRRARWVKITQDAVAESAPSKDVARMMSTMPDPRLPILESVVTTPCFGKSGTLIGRSGYHAGDHLWFEPTEGVVDIDVPSRPSDRDVAAARSLLLDDLVVDFPFSSQSDRAHFIAALLLPFARRMIDGCTPLHVFEAPSVGSGKSLLCSTIATITTGADQPTNSIPEHDDEVRKLITSKLLVGTPIMLLDNAREKRLFDCPVLAAALTATSWTDRLLGTNKSISLSNTQAWFLTGNNPRLSMELLRRSVRIRLDPKRDRAWQRDGFKHDPLLGWVRENRRELVRACLILIQAWIAAGKPRSSQRLGSFETWAATMGGILDVAGIRGFLGNLDEVYENADNESDEWRAFVSVWWDEHRTQPKKVSELLELCERFDLMLQVRGTGTTKSQQIRLGKGLSGARDRVFGHLQIEVDFDAKTKAQTYRLIRLDGDPTRKEATGQGDLFPEGDVEESQEAGCRSGYPAGCSQTSRQHPASDSAPLSHSKSMDCKLPAGSAGYAGYDNPHACAHAGTRDINNNTHNMELPSESARVRAHAHGPTGENIPHIPPDAADDSKQKDYSGGMFPPTSRPNIPPAVTQHPARGQNTDPSGLPLPDLADFPPWDDDETASPPPGVGPWQDPPG